MNTPLVVDYIVIGAGATGTAFVDTLVSETEYSIAIIDRHDSPGGHWNLSYPFVRLHGPSDVYGVNSRPMLSDQLGMGTRPSGNLASRHEVLDYYDRVVSETLIESGRVTYFPKHEASTESGSTTVCARSLLTGKVTEIIARRRVVDASYLNVTVPAMKQRGYQVDEGATVIPVGELTSSVEGPGTYTVVGGGKTAIDACLWLLNRGIASDSIRWIVPRDAWLIHRGAEANRDPSTLLKMKQLSSAAELFGFVAQGGSFMQLDPNHRPRAFRCATVSSEELEKLRSIEDVVRLGRVRRIGASSIEFERGSLPATPDTLYIDCSADGVPQKRLVPVFTDPGRITLQSLLPCQLPVSASVTAKLEAADDLEDSDRNRLATPVQNSYDALDLLDFFASRVDKLVRWSVEPRLSNWFQSTRLGNSLPGMDVAKTDQFQEEAPRLVAHLRKLRAEAK